MANRIITHENAIFNLWLNWIIAVGATMLPIILRVYLPALTIPVVTFGAMGALMLYDRFSLKGRWAVCLLLPSIAIRTLCISGVLMVVISIIYAKGFINYIDDTGLVNEKIPYLSVLIIAPVMLVVSLWSKLRDRHYSACQSCFISLGSSSERGFLGKLFSQESKYQRNFLIAISSIVVIISWGYYFIFYINVNLNHPDKFFFGWIPVILYAVSVLYLGARYFTIWAYYFQDIEGSDRRRGASTEIRFLIISGDNIFLTRNEEYGDIPDSSMYDTPATLVIAHRDSVSLKGASTVFGDISRLPSSEMEFRFMYLSEEVSGNRNTFHFICSPIDKDVMEQSAFSKGKWYNLSRLERMLNNRELSPMLAAEIHRLYTITMAWKTYDYEGRRLYKVKNYRPLFRLKGICDWDVDFNSSHWMNVARFNEDKPFFRLRRLFRKSSKS